jgi:hypothetical protein
MESPPSFLENVAHQLFKTIGVVHVEKKVKKNEKCEAFHIGKKLRPPKKYDNRKYLVAI